MRFSGEFKLDRLEILKEGREFTEGMKAINPVTQNSQIEIFARELHNASTINYFSKNIQVPISMGIVLYGYEDSNKNPNKTKLVAEAGLTYEQTYKRRFKNANELMTSYQLTPFLRVKGGLPEANVTVADYELALKQLLTAYEKNLDVLEKEITDYLENSGQSLGGLMTVFKATFKPKQFTTIQWQPI